MIFSIINISGSKKINKKIKHLDIKFMKQQPKGNWLIVREWKGRDTAMKELMKKKLKKLNQSICNP